MAKIKTTPLSKEQVAVTLHFCFCNAKDLYEEAQLLIDNQKYARAFFLCAVALEEIAKIPMGFNAIFLPKDDPVAWAGFWKAFYSHTLKQRAIKSYGQGLLKVLNKNRWAKYYKKQMPRNLPFNEMKLASLYVDCFDGYARRPNKLFTTKNSVVSIVEVVKDRLEGFGNNYSTIDKSISFVRRKGEIQMEIDGVDAKKMVVDHFRNLAKK